MDQSAAQLPVCAYDGRCYRKNPHHFQQYAHPTQYPAAPAPAKVTTPAHTPQASSAHSRTPSIASDENEKELQTPPRKQNRMESDENAQGVNDESANVCIAQSFSSPICESNLASPELLLYFLHHAPRLSALVSLDKGREEDDTKTVRGTLTSRRPRVDAKSNWAGAAEVLEEAYAGMGFCAADVQCVLTAGTTLHPAAPLSAFPEWRLVGPFELVFNYSKLSAKQTGASDEESTAIEAQLKDLLHPKLPEDAVRRWRCGRFRYDPPECQTVAVQAPATHPPSATVTAIVNVPQGEGVHLCYHRDHPSSVPGMVVEGTAHKPTFAIRQNQGWLSAYLAGWYRAKGDPTALKIAQALESALDALTHTEKLPQLAELHKKLCAPLPTRRVLSEQRHRAQVGPTDSGLGIVVPVDTKTDIGYRDPFIPPGVSFSRCLRDWEANFVRATTFPKSDSTAALTPPPNRSVHVAQLAEARPFTTKTSNALDEIFQWADVANDEGDCGASLELGLNAMACIAADSCIGEGTRQNDGLVCVPGGVSDESDISSHDAHISRIDPVLWHTFRLLDCAYMLLQRPLYRHIFRCHLRMLASADVAVSFDV